MAWEVAVLEWFAAARSPALTELAVGITALGSFAVAVALIIGLYIVEERDTALLAAAGTLAPGIVENLLNHLVMRPRPPVEHVLPAYTSSFPSGHTVIAFALAPVLSHRLPAGRAYFYTIAVLVGLTRVYLGLHYPTDVLAGAALGLAGGLAAVRYRERLLAFRD